VSAAAGESDVEAGMALQPELCLPKLVRLVRSEHVDCVMGFGRNLGHRASDNPSPFASHCVIFALGKSGRVTLQRMDNVGIAVESLDAAISFFAELGLELEGRAMIEGAWSGRATGVRDQRVQIAMMRMPDGHGRIEQGLGRGSAASACRLRVPIAADKNPESRLARADSVQDRIDDEQSLHSRRLPSQRLRSRRRSSS
jgi:hypothetical protein